MKTRRFALGLLGLLCCLSCGKDLSCYRDQILGTWVSYAVDGNPLSSEGKYIFSFDQDHHYSYVDWEDYDAGDHYITTITSSYDITCKTLTILDEIHGLAKYEIFRLNDNLLHLRPQSTGNPAALMVRELIYKKVDPESPNTKYIQQLWQAEAHDALPAFQIRFNANGSYTLYFEKQPDDPEPVPIIWEEKTDEDGKYTVYDHLLQLTFLNNPLWGNPQQKGVVQWDLRFSTVQEEGKTLVTEMYWETYVYNDGPPASRYSLRLLPVPQEEE